MKIFVTRNPVGNNGVLFRNGGDGGGMRVLIPYQEALGMKGKMQKKEGWGGIFWKDLGAHPHKY